MLRSLALSAFVVLAATSAYAQSNSSSHGSIDYSFTLDPNSGGSASDLDVVDDGSITYNLFVSGGQPGYNAPYTMATGSGVANADIDPNTYYDATSWAGYTQIDTSGYETGPEGKANASVGSQQNLRITNNGTDTILIAVSANAEAIANVGSTGTSTSSNFATVDTYIGIYDYNFATNTGVNPLIHYSGTDTAGVTKSASADWTLIGTDFYSGSYTMSIAPGETHALEFYTSSKNVTSAVPEPASLAALAVGAVAVVRRRKRA